MKKLIIFAITFSSLAVAKGPFFEGTYRGMHPAYKESVIEITFEKHNKPVSLMIGYPMPSEILDWVLELGDYHNLDETWVSVLRRPGDEKLRFSLISRNGDVEQAVLILPSGIQTVLSKVVSEDPE